MLGKRARPLQRTTSMTDLSMSTLSESPKIEANNPFSEESEAMGVKNISINNKKDERLAGLHISEICPIYGSSNCSLFVGRKRLLNCINGQFNQYILPLQDPSSPSICMASMPYHDHNNLVYSKLLPPCKFLEMCLYCKRRLGHGRDTYMYRGDKAFCSAECRYLHITITERNEKLLLRPCNKAEISIPLPHSPHSPQNKVQPGRIAEAPAMKA